MKLAYDFTPQRPADPNAPPAFAGPSLLTAIREQWGLKLEPTKGFFNVFVIESADRPTEN